MIGCALLCAAASPAFGHELRQGGKLLLTGGVTSVEGAAGGGLATWAFIAGNETDAGIGGSAHITYVPLADYALTSYGAAISLFDRVELSYAHQSFDTRKVGAALGLGRGFTFGQDIFGAKLRVAGNAVYGQNSWLPQIAVGIQHKRAEKGAIIRAVGGQHDRGTDFYVAATKVLLAQSVVIDATARMTKANQTGLLGFGGDRHQGYKPQFEGSVGWLATRRLLIGAEYRTRPSNLGFAKEDDAFDVFAAYQLTRNLALTVAYADLGSIATIRGQHGAYLSLQAAF